MEVDLLAGVLRCLANDAMQTLRNPLKRQHPGAQQVTLQLTGLARLGHQIILDPLHRTL